MNLPIYFKLCIIVHLKLFAKPIFKQNLLQLYIYIYVTNVNIGHGRMMNEVHSHGFPSMIL
jgi:hypothetical protein